MLHSFRRISWVVVVLASLVLVGLLLGGWTWDEGASAAGARIPTLYKNCTNLSDRYPHGIGKVGARDAVKGDSTPVTTFTRSNRLYRTVISYNRGLDRDKDGIACEKA